MIDPMTWRRRHPRCEFCYYYKLATPAGIHGLALPDIFECVVKRKIIHFPKMPRIFCPCYDAKHVNFERKENSNA